MMSPSILVVILGSGQVFLVVEQNEKRSKISIVADSYEMTVLVLYEFSEFTCSQNMITNIGMMVEENIKVPFIWNPKENGYSVLVCIDKTVNIMVGVGIVLVSKDANEWNELAYLCVIESYRNKGIASRIVNRLLNKYVILCLRIAINKEAFAFYLNKYDLAYNKEKDINLISLKSEQEKT
jgi:hypothetical protein